MKTLFITFCAFFLLTVTGFTQGFWEDVSLSLGYGIQQQDRRLFDFPPRFGREVVPLEESIIDQSFLFNSIKALFQGVILTLSWDLATIASSVNSLVHLIINTLKKAREKILVYI